MKKRLAVQRETIKKLVDSDMAIVNGGEATKSVIGSRCITACCVTKAAGTGGCG